MPPARAQAREKGERVGGPAAFLSYAHADDDQTGGALSALHGLLCQELRLLAGEEFPFFRDRNDLEWGQQWKKRVDDALDSASLLVIVVSPSFFLSEQCRRELLKFMDRESRTGGDLVFPLYWIDVPILRDKAARQEDQLAEYVAARQYSDWRKLRFDIISALEAVRPHAADLANRMIQVVGHPAYLVRSPRLPEGVPDGMRPSTGDMVNDLSETWLRDLYAVRKARSLGLIDQETAGKLDRAILIRRFGDY